MSGAGGGFFEPSASPRNKRPGSCFFLNWLAVIFFLAPFSSWASKGSGYTDLALSKGVDILANAVARFKPDVSTNVVRVGDSFDFILSLTNLGPDDSTNVIVQDFMPPELMFVGAAGDGAYDPVENFWYAGAIPAGSSLQMVITVLATNVAVYTNFAEIASSSAIDTNYFNDLASVSVEVDPRVFDADLGVTNGVDPSQADLGQQVVFIVGLENNGPDDVPGEIDVADCLPPGFSYVTDSTVGKPQNGFYDPTACLWKLTNGLGNTLTARLYITAMATNVGVFTNVSTVLTPTNVIDILPENNAASIVVSVVAPPPPELSILSVGSGSAVIAWPEDATNFVLEFSPGLLPANWNTVTNVPAITNDLQTVTVDVSGASGFFRLRMVP